MAADGLQYIVGLAELLFYERKAALFELTLCAMADIEYHSLFGKPQGDEILTPKSRKTQKVVLTADRFFIALDKIEEKLRHVEARERDRLGGTDSHAGSTLHTALHPKLHTPLFALDRFGGAGLLAFAALTELGVVAYALPTLDPNHWPLKYS